MFKEFYKTFIDAEIIVKKDLSTLIEMMAKPNLLGPDVLIKTIFPLMGVSPKMFEKDDDFGLNIGKGERKV